jgi:dephospho-CoA kinase
MRFIGITGGVGAGKSLILSYIQEHYNARILLADRVAQELMEPGTACYQSLREVFLDDGVFCGDGCIDRSRMAQVIFRHEDKRQQMNAIVHPAVKAYVMDAVKQEREAGHYDWFFLEAALLIEEHYDEICDELWYIYTDEEGRRQRLRTDRGYSDAKIDGILASQLSEEMFRRYCSQVIDNSGTVNETYEQIRRIMS